MEIVAQALHLVSDFIIAACEYNVSTQGIFKLITAECVLFLLFSPPF